MSSIGKEIRIRRVLVGGKALIVAMDHGVSSGPVPGLEDIRKAVANVAKGGATAVVLHKGAVRFAKDYFDEKLALILHLSASTSLGARADRKVLVTGVEEAISFGADAISVHVNIGGEDDDQMIEELGADVVKTLYTGSPDTFREVVRGCPVPVVVAGGPKLDSDRAALEMVEGA